jgi:hypothetical protein
MSARSGKGYAARAVPVRGGVPRADWPAGHPEERRRGLVGPGRAEVVVVAPMYVLAGAGLQALR